MPLHVAANGRRLTHTRNSGRSCLGNVGLKLSALPGGAPRSVSGLRWGNSKLVRIIRTYECYAKKQVCIFVRLDGKRLELLFQGAEGQHLVAIARGLVFGQQRPRGRRVRPSERTLREPGDESRPGESLPRICSLSGLVSRADIADQQDGTRFPRGRCWPSSNADQGS